VLQRAIIDNAMQQYGLVVGGIPRWIAIFGASIVFASMHWDSADPNAVVALFVLSLGLVLLSGCSSKSANPPQKTSQAPVQQNRGVPVVVHEQAVVPPAQMSPDFAARVKSIEADARLSEMERPDFSDYKQHFAAAYELAGYAPLWLMPQGLSPQGTAVIQALENSERKRTKSGGL